MFKKLLIANRGEIAVRVIRACQELNIGTVAVYSEADTGALHTELADEAILIGPPPAAESYLNQARILEAARQTRCEAIHPGYGFLSENADFAAAVRAANLIFIGPDTEAIGLMGSKTAARRLMQQAGVPVAPGYHVQESDRPDDLRVVADSISYPLMIKATAGGGGKGMRVVDQATGLFEAIEAAKREALNAFGDDRIFLEKYIATPRHIEFQILGDSSGRILHLFERECSIQRRHQKIIEETPSPLLDDALRQRMGAAAVAAAQAVNYVNAGTIEFLVDEAHNFYFLEMNTRLQVEHPVTEWVTGLDLVKWQLRLAAGERLPFSQADLSQRGHAIECRIYAEDPANDFLPDVGPVLQLIEPTGPGVRVDTGIKTGAEVTVHYDPMLAKLIVFGESRDDARQKMRWALQQYIILGVTTNIPFLREIMAHRAFHQGLTTTNFIEQHFDGWQPEGGAPDMALIAAALAELLEETDHAGERGSVASLTSVASPTSVASGKVETPALTGAGGGDTFSPWDQLRRFRMGGG